MRPSRESSQDSYDSYFEREASQVKILTKPEPSQKNENDENRLEIDFLKEKIKNMQN